MSVDAVSASPASGGAAERPLHLRAPYILLVIAGGTAGTLARAGLQLALAPVAAAPLATAVINVIGAFLLGALLETLDRRGPDRGVRRLLRLGLGTGVLGGFTTYSALAADTAVLLAEARVTEAILLAGGTVVAGLLAAVMGILGARLLPRGRTT